MFRSDDPKTATADVLRQGGLGICLSKIYIRAVIDQCNHIVLALVTIRLSFQKTT